MWLYHVAIATLFALQCKGPTWLDLPVHCQQFLYLLVGCHHHHEIRIRSNTLIPTVPRLLWAWHAERHRIRNPRSYNIEPTKRWYMSILGWCRQRALVADTEVLREGLSWWHKDIHEKIFNIDHWKSHLFIPPGKCWPIENLEQMDDRLFRIGIWQSAFFWYSIYSIAIMSGLIETPNTTQ